MWIKFLLLAKAMSVRRCHWIASGKFPWSTMETHNGNLDCDLLSPEATPAPASVHRNNYNYKNVCNLWEKWPPKWMCLSHHTSSQEWEKWMSRTDRRDAKEKHKDRILQLLSHREPDSVLCGDLNGKEIRKREDVCVCIAGPFCCIAETNRTL